MILLQILTGRRLSEIRTCDFDCLSAVPVPAAGTAGGEQPARFTYAQSKIDIAPDSILVDREVAAVIEEQQAWVRQRFPGAPRPGCSCSRAGTSTALSPTRKAATASGFASSAAWPGSSTARATRSGSATPTGSATRG